MIAVLPSRREFLRLASLSATRVALVACAPPAPAPAAPTPTQAQEAAPAEPTTAPKAPPAAAAKVELTLWGWWDLRMAIYEQAAVKFMEANPGIAVKVETLPGDELQPKVYSAVAAGTGPNMLKMGEFFFKMRDQDMLLEWPEDLFSDSWFEEMYPNVNWDAYGHYIVPTGSCGTMFVYNKPMFEEAGLDPSKPPTTWDDFNDVAQKLTQKDASGAVTRCGFVPAGEWPALSQCYQQGGNIVKMEGDKQVATFDSPEMQMALQHLIDDQAHQLSTWDPTFPSNIESVGTGLAAMTEDQSWVLGEFKGSYADIYPDLGYAPNPTPSGKPDPVWGYKSTVLDVSVLKGDAAEYAPTFQFMSFMLKEAGQDTYRALCELISCAPERADLLDDPVLAAVPGMSVVTLVLPDQHDPVQPPEELFPVWENVVRQIAVEGKLVAEAAAYGQVELQKILDDGLAKNLQ